MRPTAKELKTSRDRQEAELRAVAIRIPEILNNAPRLNFKELANILNVSLETVCIAIQRCDYHVLPIKLKDPLGRRVSHKGEVIEI